MPRLPPIVIKKEAVNIQIRTYNSYGELLCQ